MPRAMPVALLLVTAVARATVAPACAAAPELDGDAVSALQARVQAAAAPFEEASDVSNALQQRTRLAPPVNFHQLLQTATKPRAAFKGNSDDDDDGETAMTLDGYLRRCHTHDPTAIKLLSYIGRSGNRLWQLCTALELARAAGRPFVDLPGPIDDVLLLPMRMPVLSDPTRAGKGCDFISDMGTYDCNQTYWNRCRTTVAERRKLYQDNILPYIDPKVYGACSDTVDSDDIVTLHMRNGDSAYWIGGGGAQQKRHDHDQPPCLYFHEVIERGREEGKAFSRVQLVYSDQVPANPCIEDIKRRHQAAGREVLLPVNPGDYHEGVCMLLKARNLAVTMSSFGTAYKMLNQRLRRLFFVDTLPDDLPVATFDRHYRNYDFDVREVCSDFPSAVAFKALRVRNMTANEYFFHFPAEHLRETRC